MRPTPDRREADGNASEAASADARLRYRDHDRRIPETPVRSMALLRRPVGSTSWSDLRRGRHPLRRRPRSTRPRWLCDPQGLRKEPRSRESISPDEVLEPIRVRRAGPLALRLQARRHGRRVQPAVRSFTDRCCCSTYSGSTLRRRELPSTMGPGALPAEDRLQVDRFEEDAHRLHNPRRCRRAVPGTLLRSPNSHLRTQQPLLQLGEGMQRLRCAVQETRRHSRNHH
jgi:hypothetical protein